MSAAQAKAGVATATTTTPAATRSSDPPGTQTTRTLPMVSPEMNSIPLPPFMMLDDTAQASDQVNKEPIDSDLNNHDDEEKTAEEQTASETRREGESLQNQKEGRQYHVATVTEKVTALLALIGAAVIAVFLGPMRTTNQPPSQDSRTQTVSAWKRVKEILTEYMNDERDIVKEVEVQIRHALTAVKEKCTVSFGLLKSLVMSAIAAVKHYYHTRNDIAGEIKVRIVVTFTALIGCLKLSTKSATKQQSRKTKHVRRVAPVLIVACLYVVQQQWFIVNVYNHKSLNKNETGMFCFSAGHEHDVTHDGTLKSKDLYIELSPAAAKSGFSPIGLVYVTQQLITLEGETSERKNRKLHAKSVVKQEVDVAKEEAAKDTVTVEEEPSLEPTFHFGHGKNWFDFKANPSPIGLAYVTQKLLEMDD